MKNNDIIPVNKVLAGQIADIPQSITDLSESELILEVKPNRTLKRLRARFNQERITSEGMGKKLSVARICEGLIHPNYWPRLIKDQNKLAYIIKPIASIEEEFVVLQSDFMVGLRKIANTCPVNGDIKVGDWLNAAKMIVDRTAPLVQRIHQVNENAKSKKNTPTNLEDINDKIKLLEEKLEKNKK